MPIAVNSYRYRKTRSLWCNIYMLISRYQNQIYLDPIFLFYYKFITIQSKNNVYSNY